MTSILLAFPLALIRSSPAPILKYLMDVVFVSGNSQLLYLFSFLFIAIFLANLFIRFFHTYLIRLTIASVNQALKTDLFNHLIRLSADYFSKNSSGALMSRIGSDPAAIDQGISSSTVLIREPLTFLILLGYTFYLNWKLTLITFLILPPLTWIFVRANRNLRRYARKLSEQNSWMYATTQESFTGIRVIKTFGLERLLSKKYLERSQEWKNTYIKTSRMEEAAPPTVELITSFAIAAVILVGGSDVLSGKMTSGDFLGFFTAFGMMIHPLRLMNDVNVKLAAAAAATDRIFEIFSWRSTIQESAKAIPKGDFENSIRFDGVRFHYPDAPEIEILKGIDLELKRGKTLAIVGNSGAGKSSIASLLTRIYDVTDGRISIDGCDIRDLKLDSLQELVAVVSQDVFLFNDTLAENIRMGRPDATLDEIREAAKAAYAHDFIEKTPHGYDTWIGDRGQKLSGGERQRISIARAFLRKAPILILDEATSALDNASEKAVQTALTQLMANRTTLVIAHRLSTIQNADEIVVLKEGKVLERGTHSSLLELGREYSKLVQLSQT